MAVTWGTPTPATTRVVQIEPGPTPTLTASTPASTRACAPARVATLPPMTWTCRVAGSVLSRRDHVEQQPGVAVGGVDDEHVDARLDQGGGALPGVAEVADRRRRPAAGRRRPCDACGNCSDFTKSLTVISPREPAAARRPAAAARACAGAAASVASSRLMPTGAGDQRHRRHDVARPAWSAHSATGVKRRSRLVMMPSSGRSGSTTGSPETRYSAADRRRAPPGSRPARSSRGWRSSRSGSA